MWWSCCKEPLQGARGCRQGPHVEDVSYTAMLDSFASSTISAAYETTPSCDIVIEDPSGNFSYAEMVMVSPETSPNASMAANVAAEDPAAAEVPQQQESADAAGGSGVRTVPVPYLVAPHDTFSSICLKHG